VVTNNEEERILMAIPLVDLKKQYEEIQDEIDIAVHDVIIDTAFIGGKYVKEFEGAFGELCRAKYCVGVGNGTDAIYIALRALGVGPGDEVITVANSFIATSEAISLTGARVVFVDCDPATYTIDVDQVARAITPRTKAIVPVHLYGHPADMEKIREIAGAHNLFVVEDCAQAHGAEINGQRVGTFGDIGCFSFYPGKNLGAYGDGGAIITQREDLATKCRMIANHGRIDKYDHEFEGVNSRLDGLQAAILSVKLKYLEEWTEKRRAVAKQYGELLRYLPLELPVESDGCRHVYHLYVVRVKDRKAVQERLKEAGVATGIHYPIALPMLKAYQYLGHKPEDFPVAAKYSQEILSLPMYPELTTEQIQWVCDNLARALGA